MVEETWKQVGSMSPEDAPPIAEEFSKQQLFLRTYLLAAGGDELNQDEREIPFYVGLVVWKIMTKGNKKIRKISPAVIEEAEDKNWKMINYLSKEKNNLDFIKAAESIVESCNQKNVLKYVVEALKKHNPEQGNLRDQSIGMMFIYLKTVIDCLDQ